jgi:hypothetical protein
MEKERLLAMLKGRIDKAICEIVFEIQHAVYYIFSDLNSSWTKGDIEGPLLLVKRTHEPNFCIIILNKQHNNSFYQQVTLETLFEKKHPQLICIRDRSKSVHGIWSSNEEQIENLNRRLQDIQHIDSQSRMLKDLLDIGGEGVRGKIGADEGREGKKTQEEDVLGQEFYKKGVVFEEKNEVDAQRNKAREIMMVLAQDERVINCIVRALRMRDGEV